MAHCGSRGNHYHLVVLLILCKTEKAQSGSVEKELQYLISQIGIVHNSKHSCTLSIFWDGFPLLPLELSSSTVAMLPLLLLKLEGKNIDVQKKPKSIYKSGLGDTLAQLPKSAGLRRHRKNSPPYPLMGWDSSTLQLTSKNFQLRIWYDCDRLTNVAWVANQTLQCLATL
ncbi:hypothetical protein CFP56_006784 [Quercus suber]|uniref:Uncharacterized protein n=1 Tax=Quercus suber TaxID=58331 RepID=A0AAW0L964_QUESU